MTKKEILDYIIETPGNTNRAVLSGMLDSFEGGSGGGGTEPLIIRYDRTEVTGGNVYVHYFDKTWQEIADALTNFVPVYAHHFTANEEYSENPLRVENFFIAFQDGDFFKIGTLSSEDLFLVADSSDGALYFKYEGED